MKKILIKRDLSGLFLVRNRVSYFLLLITLFCSGVCSVLTAQNQNSTFEHLTINEGLSSNRVIWILRDSRDYLWISTEVGLDKYDSDHFVTYQKDENLAGTISSNNIRCIYEDFNKNLWFGTADGLNLYNPEKDNFICYKNVQGDENSLNSNYVTGIIEDNKNNLWVLTDGNCLNKWNPEKQSFTRYTFENSHEGLIIRHARMIAIDSKGSLWITAFGSGIVKFDPGKEVFTKIDNPKFDFGEKCYKSLYIDENDKIWIGTDANGFFSYDPGTDVYEQFGINGDGNGTNKNRILDIIPENNRYILLASDQGGLNRFDKVTKTFEYIKYDPSNDAGLNNNGIWCLYKDREGILWIGTSGGGINYFNPKLGKFKLFKYQNNPSSLSYNFTSCFFEDFQGLIWIGTDGGGVNIYNPKTGNFKCYKYDPSDPFSISSNTIRSITEDSDHNIWLSTWDAGLNKFDRKTGKFFHFMPEPDNPLSISGKTIWNMKSVNDTLWVGEYQGGIDLYVKNKGIIKKYVHNPDKNGSLSDNMILFFYEDSEKNIWICTSNGLNLFDRKTDSFKVFNFKDNDIEAFCRDFEGNLWVGTLSSGIYYCKPDGSIIKTFDNSNGLPSGSIKAIVEDNNNDIWISSVSGITKYDHKTLQFRTYSKEDGLQSDVFYRQSFLKTNDGELYFGGYSGFNSFSPDNLPDNDFIPPVYLSDFQIFNKPVIYSSSDSQFPVNINVAKEITLTWKQSVFSFAFIAINYTYPLKNQYSFIMEGFDKEWNMTNSSKKFATYTNLNPGEYVFKVKASNNDGIWNNEGVALKITILPPWWKTLWFRIIAILLSVSFMTFFYLVKIRNLREQKKSLEKAVTSKTIELQKLNLAKDKFFSIIAHDLKSPFNSIIGFSEVLKEDIRSLDYDTILKYVRLINDSAVSTFKLLEDLLEWANSRWGKTTPKRLSINLYELFRDELYILNKLAVEKSIQLILQIPDDFMIFADKNMIKTVLRNLISNAIKFTKSNGIIEISATYVNQQAEISVSDNGIGMNQDTIDNLFNIEVNVSTPGTENEKGTGLGLLICKEFVEQHGGKIWVESEPGKGSTFRFVIPPEKAQF